jgi:excisionase family DNA binding protein
VALSQLSDRAHPDHRTMQPKLTVTIEEACQLTGLGQTTIFGAIRNNELRKAKVGRRTLVWYDELRSWLDSKTIAQKAA